MRTARAPTTALSGKNISEDALAISTAILAVPYAVFQPDSLHDPTSSEPISEGSEDGEPIDETIELDETASTFRSLALALVPTASFFMGAGGGLFVGVADEEAFHRK